MWAGGKVVEEVGKEADCDLLRAVGGFYKDVGFGSCTGLALADPGFIKNCTDAGINIKKLCDYRDKAEVVLALEKHSRHAGRRERDCEVCNL